MIARRAHCTLEAHQAARGRCLQSMPMPETVLPGRCDVLVVGAGPAGSACARTLAAAGREVLLVDQHAFPRDKVCGDGLIPDAHAALRRLGVLDEVMSLARSVRHVRCVAPRGGFVEVTMTDGRKVNHLTRHPPGTKENPLDTAGVNAKVRDLMEPVLGAQKTNALIAQVNTLETLDDIRKLRPLLTAG